MLHVSPSQIEMRQRSSCKRESSDLRPACHYAEMRADFLLLHIVQCSDSAEGIIYGQAKSELRPGASVANTIPALFFSDIHFEPFWDPDKSPQLIAAPLSALENYQVFVASNQTGVDTTWGKEYDYAQTFHQNAFPRLL